MTDKSNLYWVYRHIAPYGKDLYCDKAVLNTILICKLTENMTQLLDIFLNTML